MAEDTKSTARFSTKEKIAFAVFAVLLVAAAFLLAWKPLSAFVSQILTSPQVEVVRSSSGKLTEAQEASRLQAELYNAALAEGTLELKTGSGEILPYDEQLSTGESGAMAAVEIPSLEINEPIYHGVSDDILASGVGHLPESALPVGGTSTHCAITGHSGMRGNVTFNDIEKMKEGDIFVLWTFNQPIAYKVYDIKVVEPTDTSTMEIQEGKDLCTLITCTPKNVNTHRLLVTGERTEYVASMSEPPLISKSSIASAVVLAFACVLVIALAGVGIKRLRARRLKEPANGKRES